MGLLAPKALFCWEKSPPLLPDPVFPNKLVDVPLAAPKPKPVLVEEVAGWLNVLDPNRPPGGEATGGDSCKFIYLYLMAGVHLKTKPTCYSSCIFITFQKQGNLTLWAL